jgi:xanthine dehydrogenase accessory factor
LNERLFTRLADLLDRGPVVLASVLDTRGATPRKGGSRMLVTGDRIEFSVGGGEAEARVVEAARALLAAAPATARSFARSDGALAGAPILSIDLSGRPGAAGVCGGLMHLALRRWHGSDDQARAAQIAQALRAGRSIALDGSDLGAAGAAETLRPNARLLIVGGGHCALALYDLAVHLDFDLWVFDPRPECFAAGQFAGAQTASGAFEHLQRALDTERDVYAILLNRDFPSDVATLKVLAARPPRFIGMMGSRKRIGEVLNALPEQRECLHTLHAPVGLELDAQTPHEIAVSILAQLIQQRRRREQEGLA